MSHILRPGTYVAGMPEVFYGEQVRPIGPKIFRESLLKEQLSCFGGLFCMVNLVIIFYLLLLLLFLFLFLL